MKTTEFRNIIYANYREAGRKFPWRDNTAPWGVMVSEFMLQQTQTERVIPYWKRWMEKWPSPKALNRASLEDALREWSGLGYNRRCRSLKECARYITEKHRGVIPGTPEKLLSFPGIGPYTAGAVACFAYNYPAVFIETNIRSVFLHFFFENRTGVRDGEIFPLLAGTLDRRNPREWYWALMDYGAALKRITVNPGRRSAHYGRQTRFEGSFRQLRGAVIRSLVSSGPADRKDLGGRTGIAAEDLYDVLEILKKEQMVGEEGGIYRIREEK
ncbi:MAG: A/G-specific adenine glycosylase [Treponema sp.]|nr:A/G-specific adenine glycosylase [Treponema sp.]